MESDVDLALRALGRMVLAESPRGWSLTMAADVLQYDAEPRLTREELDAIAALERRGAFGEAGRGC